MTMQQLKAKMTALGYRPSAGSFETPEAIFVFSVESYGAACYGASKCCLEYRKRTGKTHKIG